MEAREGHLIIKAIMNRGFGCLKMGALDANDFIIIYMLFLNIISYQIYSSSSLPEIGFMNILVLEEPRREVRAPWTMTGPK